MTTISETDQDILHKIAKIESVYERDIGNYVKSTEPLFPVARGGLLSAARSIAEHPSPHVAIITGFFIPHATPPSAETDGPIGSAHLAAGLTRVGVPVRLVTDPLCLNAVKSAARAAGIPSIPIDIIPVEAENDVSDQAVASVLDLWKNAQTPVSHVVSIERAGPSYEGRVYTATGKDITGQTAPLHLLFAHKDFITIGIGDLGNELGMGKLPRDLVVKTINHGERIACSISCDHLIFSAVSNWGALALIIAIALLRPDWKSKIAEKLNVETDDHIFHVLVKEGPAVDGDTLLQTTATCETLPWEYHSEVFREFLAAAGLI